MVILDGDMVEDGLLTFPAANLLIAAMFAGAAHHHGAQAPQGRAGGGGGMKNPAPQGRPRRARPFPAGTGRARRRFPADHQRHRKGRLQPTINLCLKICHAWAKRWTTSSGSRQCRRPVPSARSRRRPAPSSGGGSAAFRSEWERSRVQTAAGPRAGACRLRAGSAGGQCLRRRIHAPKPHEQGAWVLRFVPNETVMRADGGRPTSRGRPPAAVWGEPHRRGICALRCVFSKTVEWAGGGGVRGRWGADLCRRCVRGMAF